jgi:hypothetical protein
METKMKFINFTQHNLTEEQVAAARKMGATEIINAKDVLANFPEIANDDGNVDAVRQANEIAKAIVALAGKGDAIVHFPISSPRVQAAFWRQFEYWGYPSYADIHSKDYEMWKQVRKQKFVFSHTARVSQDVPQADGTVKKTTVFKFEKFIQESTRIVREA